MTHSNCKTEELNRLAHQAQTVIKHARIDLQAFKALDDATKATRWRSMDHLAKFDLISQRLTELHGDWEHEDVEYGIALWDGKWGAEPLATEAAVDAALERLADADQQSARTAPSDAERSYFKRSGAAYRKARLYWLAGVRAIPVKDGWLVPSQRTDGPVHRIGKDGACSCDAGMNGQSCWHAALITGIEVGGDDLNRFDDPVEPAPAPLLTSKLLGQKIAQLRATQLAA